MNQISRRTVLRGLGTVVALPGFEAMAAPMTSFETATGPISAATGAPKRMAFLYVPNGMHMQEWTPKKEGSDFELKNILKPVEKFKSKMNLLSGLTLNGARALGDGGGDHARSVAAYLTGGSSKEDRRKRY